MKLPNTILRTHLLHYAIQACNLKFSSSHIQKQTGKGNIYHNTSLSTQILVPLILPLKSIVHLTRMAHLISYFKCSAVIQAHGFGNSQLSFKDFKKQDTQRSSGC